jgi:hypothetical protein
MTKLEQYKMNEKIKELALMTYNNIGQTTPECLSLFMEIYSEKLAELIVKECATLATKEYNKHEPIHGDDLLEHFGFNFGIK